MSIKKKLIIEAVALAREYCYKDQKDKLLWTHTLQVRTYAMKLARIEAADKLVVELAAFLHDIGKYKGNKTHHETSAEIAKEFLEDKDISEEQKKLVVKCIAKHRTQHAHEDNEIEVKIIQCADALGVLFDDVWQELCRKKLTKEELENRYERKFMKINLESAKAMAKPQIEKLKKELKNIPA